MHNNAPMIPAPEKSTPVPAARRRGRPPAVDAGLVEARVLETATNLFLEQGFGRTTLDQVSRLSQTGKSALYARYADKEALFSAVVAHSIRQMFADMATVPATGTTRERLLHVGGELAKNLLVPRCVAFMRITAAEAASFPGLARMAYQVSFEGSVRCVMEALGIDPELDGSGEARVAAGRFVELALQPMSFQAAFGADILALRQRWAGDVEDAILLLETRGSLPGQAPVAR